MTNSNVLNCSGYKLMNPKITHARGSYVYENDNAYVDFEGGAWCMSLGHNHPAVNQAIIEQLDKISHIGYRISNDILEKTSNKLLNISKIQNGKCLYLCSGSEAVEFCVQAVKKISSKKYFLTFTDSFLSSYGAAGKKTNDDFILFDWTECYSCEKENCLSCSLFQQISYDEISAFIFEPGSSSGVIRFHPTKLIDAIVAKIRENNALVIANEITTGIGKTGKWFGHHYYNVIPDLIAIGKSIGNGFPVSAIVMNDKTASLLKNISLKYAQSHQNAPLGCRVVSAVIDTIENENLLERGLETGNYFITKLNELKSRYPVIREVRGRGTMIAVEFFEDENFSLEELDQKLYDNGFLCGYRPVSHILRFFIPLNMEKSIIDSFIYTLDLLLKTK